ncbi:MAG: LuxR C-terminal-related transcriptional regulator [Myxococcaceae bacterium]|nr:LuxR C-terminal-related transcriptional regulator [Myxococcaceae bacterium]
MKPRFDDIAALELAYDLSLTPAQWLDGVFERFARRLDQGLGVSVGSWVVGGASFDLVEQSPLHGNADARASQTMSLLASSLSANERVSLYGPHAIDFIGAGHEMGMETAISAISRDVGLPGVADAVGMLIVSQPARRGLMISALSRHTIHLLPSERRRLRRITTHLSSGFRLRESLREHPHPPAAVLSPSGRVLHAEGAAQRESAKEALERAVKAVDRSRGSLRRTSPEEALLMWKGLVAGEWTIVDWVDTDSRRFVVAHQNRFSSRSLRALAPREVDIAEYLVQGRSTSEIAYALGLQVGTVSRATRTLLRRLGVKSRADLAALFGGVAPMKAPLDGQHEVFALTAGPNVPLWARLSPSEKRVVELTLRGRPLAQVAAARGVSTKTVKNQLGSVYARFGVRGRAELATLLGGVPSEG